MLLQQALFSNIEACVQCLCLETAVQAKGRYLAQHQCNDHVAKQMLERLLQQPQQRLKGWADISQHLTHASHDIAQGQGQNQSPWQTTREVPLQGLVESGSKQCSPWQSNTAMTTPHLCQRCNAPVQLGCRSSFCSILSV